MNISENENLTAEQLVDLYAAIGVEQGDASDRRQNGRFNRLYDKKRAIEQELRGRPGDQRRYLTRLYSHDNMQVRLNAAKATLAVAPIEARRQLELIKASQHFPQAADAGMSLWNLERGVFKPE